MTPIYTAEALATGDGRNGHARTSDGKIDLDLDMPKKLGGSGVGMSMHPGAETWAGLYTGLPTTCPLTP